MLTQFRRMTDEIERLRSVNAGLSQQVEDGSKMIDPLRNRADALDAILADRFRRSSPIEEKLLAAGMGKAPLPTQAECLQWAVKLGVPAP